MAKKIQRCVRLEKWMIEALLELAEERNITYSAMVNMLLEWELNHLGKNRSQYNAKVYEIGRRGALSDIKKQNA